MSSFVHLHAHSHYSLLDGLGNITDMVKRVKADGANALALTDHGVLYGAIDFYEAAKKEGIKPIIGCEAYVSPGPRQSRDSQRDAKPYHLILLVKNKTGYRNLLKLVTEAHLTGFYYKPRIDWELLERHHEGLICTSACLASETSQLILGGQEAKAREVAERHAELFGPGNYYLELQHHPSIPEQARVNEALKRIAKETGIPLVATNDSHYVMPEDEEPQDVLLCIQTGKMLEDTDRMKMTGEDFSLKPAEQMARDFSDVPEAVTNTVKIAEACDLEIELGGMILPKFSVPEGVGTDREYLRRLVYSGMFRRYRTSEGDVDLQELHDADAAGAKAFLERHGLNDEMMERVDYELSVIERMGYESYFLIVQDFVNWAKAQGIMVGPGRGSGAGSIIAYALNITNIDPLAFGLLFERFLNPDRISMPDFDLDFADDRRQEVIDYVSEKYGQDHVAQIITFGTMGAKAAVRDTGRVMGVPYSQVDEVCKLIPNRPGTRLADARAQSDIKALEEADARTKRMLDLAARLEGSNRHASTHAAGVVIGDRALVNYVPLQYATRGDTSIVTQYSMNPIERIGLLKMDFLGLSNLTILRNATEIIEAVHGKTIDPENLPLDDAKTYDLLSRAQTYGVFQLESDGMRRYLRELKPKRFEDIVAMVSLYRPGPMQFIDTFIRRKHGKEQVSYAHPKVEEALKETYGVIVYQEQVMQISKDLAGFTGGEADTLRKAMGKKIATLMAQMRQKFIDGVVASGEPPELGERLFGQFEEFAQYGFNKAHAACYALIAYQTAYLKAHYPSAFMAALMTSEQENLDKLTTAINDAENLGIKVLPPDVNESYADFAVSSDKRNLRFGLKAIKHVGRNTVEAVIKGRKADGRFTSLTDFLSRMSEGCLNRKSLESLIKAGALDSLADRGQMLAGLETLTRFAAVRATAARAGQTSLFGGETMPDETVALPPSGEVDPRQKLDWERELLGMYVSEHPLGALSHLMKDFPPLSDISRAEDSQPVTVGGLLVISKKITTRAGDPMAFVTIEDQHTQCEVIVFPKLYADSLPILLPGALIKVKGKISHKDGEAKILADKIAVLSEETAGSDTGPLSMIEGLEPTSAESPDPSAVDKAADGAQEAVAKEPVTTGRSETVTIELSPQTTLQTLEKIRDILAEHRGESPVCLVVPRHGSARRLRLTQGVRHSKELLEALHSIDREATIAVG